MACDTIHCSSISHTICSSVSHIQKQKWYTAPDAALPRHLDFGSRCDFPRLISNIKTTPFPVWPQSCHSLPPWWKAKPPEDAFNLAPLDARSHSETPCKTPQTQQTTQQFWPSSGPGAVQFRPMGHCSLVRRDGTRYIFSSLQVEEGRLFTAAVTGTNEEPEKIYASAWRHYSIWWPFYSSSLIKSVAFAGLRAKVPSLHPHPPSHPHPYLPNQVQFHIHFRNAYSSIHRQQVGRLNFFNLILITLIFCAGVGLLQWFDLWWW